MKSSCLMTAPSSPQQQRAAFTLIEVLIALGLSLILISAIYSAISIHWRYEEAGRDRIDRSQLSLAVLRLLSEDIGSVSFRPPEAAAAEEEDAEGSTSSTASSGSTTSGTASSTASDTDDTGSTTTSSTVASSDLGVVGTADLLQLDISYPVRDDFIPVATSTSSTKTTPQSSQIRVIWGMVTPSLSSGSGTGTGSGSGMRSLTVNPALARQMSDRLREVVGGGNQKNKQSDSTSELNESSIIAREVVSLQFRYYDGYAWASEWDSTTKERLPRAIEVAMGFIQPEYKRPGSLNLPGSEKIITIKHVFLVPASVPISGEEL